MINLSPVLFEDILHNPRIDSYKNTTYSIWIIKTLIAIEHCLMLAKTSVYTVTHRDDVEITHDMSKQHLVYQKCIRNGLEIV